MKMKDYLKQFKEETPTWIKNYKAGEKVSFKTFMSERVGFYPYGKTDGSFMKLGNVTHCVHCFMYVNDELRKSELDESLDRYKIRGYHQVGIVHWNMKDLCPKGPHPLEPSISIRDYATRTVPAGDEFCCMIVFERDSDQSEENGAERFAVTFLKSDPIAAYYQLFSKEYEKVPWLFMLRSFGEPMDLKNLGRGKLMHKIIELSGRWPQFVITDNRCLIWSPYCEVDIEPFCRTLKYKKEEYYLYHLMDYEMNSKHFHRFRLENKNIENWGRCNADKLLIENNVLVHCAEDITGHVDIPQGVVEIRDHVFWRRNITSVNIPDSVMVIGFRCFGETPLKSVRIPDGINFIEDKLFFESQIESVSLPEDVSVIGKFAFADCKNLKNINMPSKLKRIEMYSFRGCDLSGKITLPDGVQEIECGAFESCSRLTEISIPEGTRVAKDAFVGCNARIIVRKK